jgi:hypothetical protein
LEECQAYIFVSEEFVKSITGKGLKGITLLPCEYG